MVLSQYFGFQSFKFWKYWGLYEPSQFKLNCDISWFKTFAISILISFDTLWLKVLQATALDVKTFWSHGLQSHCRRRVSSVCFGSHQTNLSPLSLFPAKVAFLWESSLNECFLFTRIVCGSGIAGAIAIRSSLSWTNGWLTDYEKYWKKDPNLCFGN